MGRGGEGERGRGGEGREMSRGGMEGGRRDMEGVDGEGERERED